NRLENNGRNLSGVFLEPPLDGCEIVKGSDQDVLKACFRNAKSSRHRSRPVDIAEVRSMRLYADQSGIMQTVVRAFELQNLVAPRGSAGKTNSVHGSFGPAIAETHHLDWKAGANFFCQLPFHVMGHAEHRARREALPHSFHHRWMTMPRHQRAKAEIVVEIVVAIQIAKVRASAFLHKNWIGIIGAVITGNAQRNALQIF